MKICRKENIEKLNVMAYQLLYAQQLNDNQQIESIHIDNQNNQICVEGLIRGFESDINCLLNFDSEGNLVSWTCDDKDQAKIYNIAIIQWLLNHKIDQLPFHYQSVECSLREKTIKEKQQKRWEKKKDELLKRGQSFLNSKKQNYEQNLMMEATSQNIEIVPVLNDDEELELSFKVGKKNKYVIKNIPEFIRRVDQKVKFSYGKNLEFVHHINCFNDEGRKQIEFMKNHLGKFNHAIFYEYINEKYFVLKGSILDDFFNSFSKIDDKYNYEEEEASINIKVNEIEDLYEFQYNDKPYLYGDNYLYEYNPNAELIIRYQADGNGKIVDFVQELSEQNMYILKSEYQQFYKYVLSEIYPYLNIEGAELLSATVEPCTSIKLYGDIDDEGEIFVNLEYYNENGEIKQGFDEENIIGYTQDLVEAYIQKYATYIDKTNHKAYFNSEDEDTLEFISNGLPYLSQYCEVFVSDTLKKLGQKHEYTISVGVKYSNNLLSIDIDSLEIPKSELGDVLNAYRRRKKFYRLKNGKLIVLDSNQIEEIDDLLDTYHLSGKDLKNGSLNLPSYRLFSMNEKMNDSKYIQVNRSKSFEKQLERFDSIKNNHYSLSKHYSNILRDYQKDGFQWLSLMRDYGFNAILADDMGLGKTLQVIALLDENKSDKPSLVICPASLIYNWDDEIHKFSSTLNAICVCGNASQRQAKILEGKDCQLMITSYDYIRRDIDLYDNMIFDTIILDEAQNIKNQKTKNAISVKKLKADHKIALTGTPIENSLAELWSIFDFLMPNYLFNYHYFQSEYEIDIIKNQNEEKQEILKKFVSPFILRRNKKDVLKELPEKIEKVQLIDFDEEEYKIYLANLAQVNDELASLAHTETNDKIAIFAMMTRLRQLCCEPRLMYENITKRSSKMNACMELIHNFHDNHQKILLFSSFTSMLDLIEKELHREGISFYKLTGQTSKENRKLLVDQFQNDDTTVFLISLKAGGTGLNLTAAQGVIHYDPWWNQSAQNQATDRAYRIGQDKNVQVFKLVMKNSIEEKIQELQLMKKELADTFIENNEVNISKMSKDDLMQLFTMNE